MLTIDFEKTEIEALLQIINAVSVKGSDARLIVNILDKLENATEKELNPTSGER